MTNLNIFEVTNDGETSLTVFIDGDPNPLIAAHSPENPHRNWNAIQAKIEADDPEGLSYLFDVTQAIAAAVENRLLSSRMKVAHGRILLDGQPVNNALTKQIVRFLEEGVNDWLPLVRFMERVIDNPTEHSREQLYRWLDANQFTITEDGLIVGYKGVKRHESGNGDGTEPDVFYTPTRNGPGIVNGEPTEGPIVQRSGDVVEMDRENVVHDPSVACSVGLHVADESYARGCMNTGCVIEVRVDPRDVVSVTHDQGDRKMRVSKYVVVGEVEQAYQTPLLGHIPTAPDVEEETHECDECEDGGLIAQEDCEQCGTVDYGVTPATDGGRTTGDGTDALVSPVDDKVTIRSRLRDWFAGVN